MGVNPPSRPLSLKGSPFTSTVEWSGTGSVIRASAKQPFLAFLMRWASLSAGSSDSTLRCVSTASHLLNTVPLSTEPPSSFRNRTETLAPLISIFIMCAYRDTWVSSQNPVAMAR